MAVSAGKDIKVTAAANLGHQDMRQGSPVLAGSYFFEAGDERRTGWHSHDLHQLEYAFQGVAQVETESASYFLPPQQAVWIPAGVEHCTTLTRVRTASLFFDPRLAIEAGDRVRVLGVAPVIREMVLYARRWPIGRPSADPVSSRFFATVGELIAESLDEELPLALPTSRHPLVAAAMRYTLDHLGTVTADDLCAAVGASERTLRRAFLAEAGTSWSQYLQQARLLRAMALLSEPGPGVLAVATAVGFGSLSGFARAFRRCTGETPLSYRQRVLTTAAAVPQRSSWLLR
jgi:AraC-like DNA-binding protein